MIEKFNEDYTAAVLAGIPIFCVNRKYETFDVGIMFKQRFRFTFNNGYAASVIEFADKSIIAPHQYELAVLMLHKSEYVMCYDTPITNDVERGNDLDMHRLLTAVEALSPQISG